MELSHFGYKVITANSGVVNAIETMQNNPGIHLILMDIDLGSGIDGTEAEAFSLNVHDRIPAELQEKKMISIQELSHTGILEPCRTSRLTRDGSIAEVSIISTAPMNETGQMYAVAITERLVKK